jgi:hypothetical protein
MDGFLPATSIFLRGEQHMEKIGRKRRDWPAYALAAGFVLVSSGAVLPQISARVVAVVTRLGALLS